MKKLFSLLSVLMILFSMTSCKLLFDFRPSYLQALKSNEAKVGNVVQVVNSSSDSRLVISSDDLDYGEYENNGESFLVVAANEEIAMDSLGDKFISQVVEYDDLSDYVKSYIDIAGYYEKVYQFQKGHVSIGNLDDIDDSHIFVEVNVYLKDNEPNYCVIVVLPATAVKYNYLQDDISNYIQGQRYYFNGDMTQVFTIKEINAVKFPDQVTE